MHWRHDALFNVATRGNLNAGTPALLALPSFQKRTMISPSSKALCGYNFEPASIYFAVGYKGFEISIWNRHFFSSHITVLTPTLLYV
jgi:hypothetical protein